MPDQTNINRMLPESFSDAVRARKLQECNKEFTQRPCTTCGAGPDRGLNEVRVGLLTPSAPEGPERRDAVREGEGGTRDTKQFRSCCTLKRPFHPKIYPFSYLTIHYGPRYFVMEKILYIWP